MELFPFFDGLIPEGYLFNLAVKIYNINPFNRFDVLLKTCADTIGCVSLKEDLHEWLYEKLLLHTIFTIIHIENVI